MILALAACGTAPGITLVIDSATAELIRGATVELEVALTRSGGAGADIVLDVTGLPASVSASFSPATLSGATLTSTLTLSAAAAAIEGSYDLTVTGTGTGLVASAGLGLEVMSLDVTGRVVTIYEIPLPNISVSSQGASAVTDVDGNFSLTGLSVPYDLSVCGARHRSGSMCTRASRPTNSCSHRLQVLRRRSQSARPPSQATSAVASFPLQPTKPS